MIVIKGSPNIKVNPVGKVSQIVEQQRIHCLCAIIKGQKKYALLSREDQKTWDKEKNKNARQQLFIKYFNFNNLKNIKSSVKDFEFQKKLSL